MQQGQASLTALVSSFGRAYHAACDEPQIFDDYLAKELLSEEEYAQISGFMLGGLGFFAPEKEGAFTSNEAALKWVLQTQIMPTPLARARYCEDMLQNAIAIGSTQYVILGAGMDTFAYRNPQLLKKISVYEVDHPATQAAKKERVQKAGWPIPDRLHDVPLDFGKDSLPRGLAEAGFDFQQRTFFSWLGVSFYLSKEQNEALWQAIASFAARGSSLVFDHADSGMFTSPVKRVQNTLAMARAGGEPMQSAYGYTELETLLAKYGFLIYEYLTPAAIQERFFAGRIDYLTAFEHIAYVLAVLK